MCREPHIAAAAVVPAAKVLQGGCCMITLSAENLPTQTVGLRDAQWGTRWLVVGLAVLFLWRAIAPASSDWLSQFPSWLVLAISFIVPYAFLLLFPIITRTPRRCETSATQAPPRFLVELGIAIPVVIVTIVAFTVVEYVLGRVSPGTSVTPEAVTDLARSPNHTFVIVLLLISFTVAPVAEEVFFRGFLYNAFRARMPWAIAGFAQSFIFGFAHLLGLTHAIAASVIGLLLTAIYEWRKTLATPIFVHAGINLVVAIGIALMMIAHANSPVMGVIGDPDDIHCVVREVAPQSAADQAGLQSGDVITSLNGQPVRDFSHLVEAVSVYQPGDAVAVTINRAGESIEITVVLRRRGP